MYVHALISCRRLNDQCTTSEPQIDNCIVHNGNVGRKFHKRVAAKGQETGRSAQNSSLYEPERGIDACQCFYAHEEYSSPGREYVAKHRECVGQLSDNIAVRFSITRAPSLLVMPEMAFIQRGERVLWIGA